MESTEKIFINPQGIRECSQEIKLQNAVMKNVLNNFTKEIHKLDLNWDALGANEMVESFETLRPSFDGYDNYLKKVTNFLDQNVAESVEALDEAIQGSASQLRAR